MDQRYLASAALVCAALLPPSASAEDAAACEIREVRWSGAPAPWVTIAHSGEASFQVETEPHKLILKFEACRDATRQHKLAGDGALLKELRWAQHEDDVVWVVLDLVRVPEYAIERTEGGVVVRLRPPAPDATPAVDEQQFASEFVPLPASAREEAARHSWREGCPVGLDELRLLRIVYWGFDGQAHQGELVLHRDLAAEVLAIFAELFEARFPIEKMRRIEAYQGDDQRSMADNNTSAFNCRNVLGRKNTFSNHAYGVALDINPVQNPYVKKQVVEPAQGSQYLDRRDARPGMVRLGDACHKAFVSRGWTWGGAWRSLKDYQHFEKKRR